MVYDPEQVVLVYNHTFAARTDVYAIWTPGGWRPVRSPLTTGATIAGITGTGPAISGYMIAPGSESHVLAIDFDTDNGLDQAFALARTMAEHELPTYIETSRRGAHLWCILDYVIPASTIRKAARALLASALLPTDDPHIEIRPGSDSVDAEWDEGHHHVLGLGLGHALRLPLMPHPKTGQRGTMFRADNTTMGKSLAEIVLNTDIASSVTIRWWAQRWNPPVDKINSAHRPPRPPREEDDSSASELLATLWGVVEPLPGRNSHCPVHGRDRNPSLTVMKDDRRVICRVPGCILNNSDKGRGTWELRAMAPRHD